MMVSPKLWAKTISSGTCRIRLIFHGKQFAKRINLEQISVAKYGEKKLTMQWYEQDFWDALSQLLCLHKDFITKRKLTLYLCLLTGYFKEQIY